MHLYIIAATQNDINENLIHKYRYFLVIMIHFVDNNIIWKDLRSMNCMWQRYITETSIGRHDISNHRTVDCLSSRLFRLTPKHRIIGTGWGELTYERRIPTKETVM